MSPPTGEEKPKTEETNQQSPPNQPAGSTSNDADSTEPVAAEEGSLDNSEQKSSPNSEPEKTTESTKSSGGNPLKKIFKKFDIYFLYNNYLINSF